MLINSNTFGKLPIAFQTVLAFVLVLLGAWIGINAELLAQGTPGMSLAFLLIAVMFFVNGVPALLEGVMTMLYKKEQ